MGSSTGTGAPEFSAAVRKSILTTMFISLLLDLVCGSVAAPSGRLQLMNVHL